MPRIEFTAAAVRRPGTTPAEIVTVVATTNLHLTQARVSLIGANGSGKSTLLRLVNGLVTPTEGTVTVDGLDTVTRAREVRQRVAFAFTDPAAQLVMPTGREDVDLSLRRRHPDRSARRSATQAVLDEYGLAEVADRSVMDLSGGERQRMALASVLATSPQVLVLDEPSTLLDLANTLALRRLLAALPQMVLFATHDLDLALEADRTLVMDSGRVIFDGNPVEAVARYREQAQESMPP